MTTTVTIEVPSHANGRVKVQPIDPVTLQHLEMVKEVLPGQTVQEHILANRGLILTEEQIHGSRTG